jgi:hypothetical protein
MTCDTFHYVDRGRVAGSLVCVDASKRFNSQLPVDAIKAAFGVGLLRKNVVFISLCVAVLCCWCQLRIVLFNDYCRSYVTNIFTL